MVGVVCVLYFWNEYMKMFENYVNIFASVATMERNVVAGDVSFGYFVMLWSEFIWFY